MTSETPILNYTWPMAVHEHQAIPALPGSHARGTVVVGTDENRVADLVLAFNAWAEGELATPVDEEYLCRFHEEICRLMALRPDPARLLSASAPTPTENPAADLRRWLSPEIAIPSIAAACGVSERGFYGWLAGGGMR